MKMNEILVILVIAFAVVGLSGGASAYIYDEYLASSYIPIISVSPLDEYHAGSFAHTSIDYTSHIISVSEDYYGTHTCDFSASGITTHTDVTLDESPSAFDAVDSGAYIPSPSAFDFYVPPYSFWP